MDNLHTESCDVQTLLKSLDGYLRRRGRASSTRQQYGYSLRGFADWLGRSAVGELTAANLELFLIHWEAESGLVTAMLRSRQRCAGRSGRFERSVRTSNKRSYSPKRTAAS